MENFFFDNGNFIRTGRFFFKPFRRARFIEDIDCLVRQQTAVNIAFREPYGLLQRVFGISYAVKIFIAAFKAV